MSGIRAGTRVVVALPRGVQRTELARVLDAHALGSIEGPASAGREPAFRGHGEAFVISRQGADGFRVAIAPAARVDAVRQLEALRRVIETAIAGEATVDG